MVSALCLRPTVQRRWKEQDWREIHMWGASSAKGRLLAPRSHSGGSTSEMTTSWVQDLEALSSGSVTWQTKSSPPPLRTATPASVERKRDSQGFCSQTRCPPASGWMASRFQGQQEALLCFCWKWYSDATLHLLRRKWRTSPESIPMQL